MREIADGTGPLSQFVKQLLDKGLWCGVRDFHTAMLMSQDAD